MKINKQLENLVNELFNGADIDDADEIREYFSEENLVHMFGVKHEYYPESYEIDYTTPVPYFADEDERQAVIETAMEMWKREREE